MISKPILFAQIIIGAGDLITGLLLLLAPTQTLKIMQISQQYTDTGLLSFIGIFVFSIGLSYFLVPLKASTTEQLAQWKMQWKVSATVRLSVALFIAFNIVLNQWDIAWSLVLLCDLGYGLFQLIGIKKKWLDKPSMSLPK